MVTYKAPTRTLQSGLILREYESAGSVLEGEIEASPACASDIISRYKEICRPAWAGFQGEVSDMRAAVRSEIAQGWPEGARIIEAAREGLSVALRSAKSLRPKIAGGYSSGFDPFVPGLLQGRPDNWRQWEPRKRLTGSKGVTIIADTSAAAYYASDSLVWSGAVALILADMLTTAGYTVEIKACSTVGTDTGNKRVCSMATVKRAEDPLNIDGLASVLVSPRFYRVGMLPLCWTFEGIRCSLGGGHVDSIRKGEIEEIYPNAIHVPRVFGLNAARALLVTEIDRINGGES
jgi:hypothetical protein